MFFLSFFPNPALAVLGTSVGLQLVQALVGLLFFARLRMVVTTTSFRAFIFLLFPLLLSFTVATLAGLVPDVGVALGTYVSTAFTLLSLPVFGWLSRGRSIDDIVAPVALALVVNGILVIYQIASFQVGSFPFTGWYTNPSFLNAAEDGDAYATWVARPMGVFPEPSAMAACIGPWAVLLLYHGATRRGARPRLALAAGIVGVGSVVLSTSVYAPFVVASSLIALAIAARRPNSNRLAVIVLLVAIGFAFLALNLGEAFWRANLEYNSSSQARLGSIVEGSQLPLRDAIAFWFGFGPGQVGIIFASESIPYPAMWSVLLRWWTDGGVLGFAGLVAVIVMALRRAVTPALRMLLILWIVSVSIVTSYLALIPIWAFLAFLLDNDESSRGRE